MIEFISGGEGILFAETMNAIQKKIRALGPLGKSEGIEEEGLKARLEAVTKILTYVRLVERESLRVADLKTKEAYEAFFNSDEVNRIFKEMVAEKLAISEIMSLLRQKPLPTGKIAEALGMTPSDVSRHMSASARHGLVRYDTDQKCYALA